LSHWPILPVLIPLLSALLCLLVHRSGRAPQRIVGLVAALALAVTALYLLRLTDDGTIAVYRLGDWPPPYGIVLAHRCGDDGQVVTT
jgi:multicomponent K+:H+ antiporter subunit D